MRVMRASTAGFCMGVSLALQKLEAALAKFGNENSGFSGRICTLGPIIHNPQVLAHFESLGVISMDDAAHARSGDCVIIRAHGVPRGEEEKLRAICGAVEDATCPKVKKAQLAIAGATAEGAALLLFGEAAHPEVRGLISYAKGKAHVFGEMGELDKIPLDSDFSYVLASQTTQDRERFGRIAAYLRGRLPNLRILSTICDATRQRQNEAAAIAAQVDAMVVVGGRQSGNTRRLANLSRQAGIPAFHVETVDELVAEDFRGKLAVGLTAGASTPKNEIDAAEKWLLNVQDK